MHNLPKFSSQEIASKFQHNQFYDRTFTFDHKGRIAQSEFGTIDSASSRGLITLDQCFDFANKVDHLKGADRYDCVTCKSKQEALKHNQIHKVPNILMITLQRFKSGHKNNDLVDFPIRGFDLSKHTITKDASMIYDLYGIVNHSGTLGFGHYTAKCFNGSVGKWLHYNDSMVSEIQSLNTFTGQGYGFDSSVANSDQVQDFVSKGLKNELVTSHAYVLFYKRRGFNPESIEDFEALKISNSGEMDHLIHVTESTQASSTAPSSTPPPTAPSALETPFAVPQKEAPSGAASSFLESANSANLEDLQQIHMMEMAANDPKNSHASALDKSMEAEPAATIENALMHDSSDNGSHGSHHKED